MQKDYLESFASTSIGCVRENNEDAALMMRKERVFVVADGMGGGDAGEVASSMLITEIERRVQQVRLRPAELESAVIRSVYSVNQQIREHADVHGYECMGTTVACLLFNPWHPAYALAMHAGDSRIYRLRKKGLLHHIKNNNIEQLTHDHSDKPGSNVITNAVGFGLGFYLESTSVDVQAGDLFIICSDGLSHMVPDREIARICKEGMLNDTTETICMNLVNRALEKGGKDNVTVIVIRVHDFPEDYTPSEQEAEEECEIQLQNIHALVRTIG